MPMQYNLLSKYECVRSQLDDLPSVGVLGSRRVASKTTFLTHDYQVTVFHSPSAAGMGIELTGTRRNFGRCVIARERSRLNTYQSPCSFEGPLVHVPTIFCSSRDNL